MPDKPAIRRALQRVLNDGGYPMPIDGIWGHKSAAALADVVTDDVPAVVDPNPLARFQVCLPLILKHEGGYVDHPKDPGGATNLGVTLATARAHALDLDGDGDVDKADVRALKPEDVGPVYHRGYWRPAGCDECAPGLDYIVFDCAVNQGVGRAVRFLQATAGVAEDGMFGPSTATAVKRLQPASAINRMADLRERHYRSLGAFPTFGRGWLRRLNEVKAQALIWA